MQGIQGNSTSWAQFMQLTQQARSRNSGFSVSAAAKARSPQPQKRIADVYTRSQPLVSERKAPVSSTAQAPKKSVGSYFDAYA